MMYYSKTFATPRIDRSLVHGATLLCVTDTSLPIVRFAVALRSGSMDDPRGQEGLTRLLAEMLLRGTRTRTRQQFHEELESLGSSVSASVAADVVSLRGACLKRNLKATFELLAEALTEPAFDAEEHESLVEESCDELLAERDEDDAVAELFLRQALYPNHALAHAPSGTVDGLNSVTPKDLQKAHAQRFAAAGMVIAAAGDITLDDLSALCEPWLKQFATVSYSEKALAEQPEPAGTRVIIVDKPDRTQVQLRLARPGLHGTHADCDAFWLGIMAFGGTFTSRFTREVRDIRGWSYTAHADFRRRNTTRAPVVMRSAPAIGDAVECLALELSLYQELARGLVDAAAIEQARDYLLNRYPFEIASANDVLSGALQFELMGLAPTELFAVPERLRSVQTSQVGNVLQRHLHPNNIVAVLVAPQADVMKRLRQAVPTAQIEVIDFRNGVEGIVNEIACGASHLGS